MEAEILRSFIFYSRLTWLSLIYDSPSTAHNAHTRPIVLPDPENLDLDNFVAKHAEICHFRFMVTILIPSWNTVIDCTSSKSFSFSLIEPIHAVERHKKRYQDALQLDENRMKMPLVL